MGVVHVAIMVAVFGVVVMIVGVVVHPVHPLHFTRLRRLALPSRFDFVMTQNSARVLPLVVRCMPETAKEHRQECPSRLRTSLCYQWEV
jgi:Na+/H+-dicarboxylate symporter